VLAEYGLAEETRVSGRTSLTEVETLQLALFTSS
jgi:hypothetical protein